jgi:hypothetical protein
MILVMITPVVSPKSILAQSQTGEDEDVQGLFEDDLRVLEAELELYENCVSSIKRLDEISGERRI